MRNFRGFGIWRTHWLANVPFQFYYGVIFMMEADYIYLEREYIAGKANVPKGESFLEREQVTSGKWINSVHK